MIFFTYDFGGEEPDTTLIRKAKFQKENGREGCAVGKRSGEKEFATGM